MLEDQKLLKKIQKVKDKIKVLEEKGTEKSLTKIEKLKEEIEKMVKFGLRDGKLKRLDDDNGASNVTPNGTSNVTPNGTSNVTPVPQQPQIQQPQIQQPQMQQPQIQQPQIQQQIQQPQMQQPQPEIMQQPMVNPKFDQISNQPHKANVIISLIEGKVLPVIVDVEELENFTEVLKEAIDNQSCLEIGRRVINGRYITDYEIEI